ACLDHFRVFVEAGIAWLLGGCVERVFRPGRPRAISDRQGDEQVNQRLAELRFHMNHLHHARYQCGLNCSINSSASARDQPSLSRSRSSAVCGRLPQYSPSANLMGPIIYDIPNMAAIPPQTKPITNPKTKTLMVQKWPGPLD